MEIYRRSKLLDTLRSQYSRSIVYAYKNKSNYDYLNFIFLASNFNDAIKRVTYLKTYRSYREQRGKHYKETQALIAQKKSGSVRQKKQKDNALQNQTEYKQKHWKDKRKKKDVSAESIKVTRKKICQKQFGGKERKRQGPSKSYYLNYQQGNSSSQSRSEKESG